HGRWRRVARDHVAVEIRRRPWPARERAGLEPDQPEVARPSLRPLEVVHQRPVEVAPYVSPGGDRVGHRAEVGGQVASAGVLVERRVAVLGDEERLAGSAEATEKAAQPRRVDLPAHLVEELRRLPGSAETLESRRRAAPHEDPHVVVQAEDVEAPGEAGYLLSLPAGRPDPAGRDPTQVPPVHEMVLLLRLGAIFGIA